MIKYSRVNQQKIFNLITKKIYVLSSIRFDENFSYYDTCHKVVDKNANNDKINDIQNKANDKKFSKVIIRKEAKKEAIFCHPIFQS